VAAKRNVLPGYLKRVGAIPTPCVRSMLAYWMGGAWQGGIAPPIPPVEEQHASGEKLKFKSYEEEDILILIPTFLAVIEEDR
jgi:hypothetical protein